MPFKHNFIIPLLIGLLLISFQATSQVNSWKCGDDKLFALQQAANPDFQQWVRRHNEDLRQYISYTHTTKTSSAAAREAGELDAVYNIPVVVHVVHPKGEAYGTGTNITYAQIRSQIEALNAAFSKSYSSYNGQSHPAYAQDAGIRFCLARNTAPASVKWATGPGGTEYGVIRYEDNSGAYDHLINETGAKQLLSVTHPSQEYFPFDTYLNIWLVKTIDGANSIMGYAPRPITSNYPLDGIVMRADIFGDNTTGGNYPLNFYLTQGKVLVHEMGHYFDLYHIFQGGCAGLNPKGSATDACDLNGDFICDIEPCTTQNTICFFGTPNTCKANYNTGTTSDDMINDYMSYADDDCMNTFTADQVHRMQGILEFSRRKLWQSANLAATGVLSTSGCVPPYLNATINTDKQTFCSGDAVLLSNPAAGNTAKQYNWRMPGGSPSVSSADTVTVTYTRPGNYTIYLTVSDGTNIRSDSLGIAVLTCNLDSSKKYMAQWFFNEYCSVDFSTGTAVKTNTALNNKSIHSEAAYDAQLPYSGASISLCDSSGKLLFYSNGVSVWNNLHKKITDKPIFGANDINLSTGLCYIPYVNDPDKYFIIGGYPNFDNSPHKGLRFVTVDVKANSVSAYKEFSNPVLPESFSQQLTVVPHCNGTDYWIITQGSGFSNDTRFYAFIVNKDGIDIHQTPVISSGFSHPSYNGSGNGLKANRTGNKLALFSPHGYINIETGALYDFDTQTGRVSNEKPIPNVPGYNNIQGGGAFSPNGQYFYLMRSTDSLNRAPYWLFQYRVSDFKYNIIPTTGFYFAASYQLGPDGQLYILNLNNYLARAANPDVWGGVVFNGEFISFATTDFMSRASCLPAFIDAKRLTPDNPDFSIKALSCDSFEFKSICFDNYTATWNFGDNTSPVAGQTVTHRYTTDGHYKITLTLSSNSKTYGSVTKEIDAISGAIGITGPDSVCNTTNFISQYFCRPINGATYQWSVIDGNISGAKDLSFAGISWQNTRADSGIVKLDITAGDNCTLSASKTVAIFKKPVINFSLPDEICDTDSSIVLQASPSGGVFDGPGVTDSIFNPSTAGTGSKEIRYLLNAPVCKTEVSKVIKVKSSCDAPKGKLMPQSFTPNNDGLNDLYRIPRGMLKNLQQFSIFNRWGIKVFTTTDIRQGWNGMIKGTSAQAGTYVYFISGTDEAGKNIQLRGTVVLIR